MKDEVKRFDWMVVGPMDPETAMERRESPDGEYVLATDYDRLRAERDALAGVARDYADFWDIWGSKLDGQDDEVLDERDRLAKNLRTALEPRP